MHTKKKDKKFEMGEVITLITRAWCKDSAKGTKWDGNENVHNCPARPHLGATQKKLTAQ